MPHFYYSLNINNYWVNTSISMKHVHSIMVLARNNKHQNLINAKQYNVVLSQQCITPFISQTGEQLLTADNKFVS